MEENKTVNPLLGNLFKANALSHLNGDQTRASGDALGKPSLADKLAKMMREKTKNAAVNDKLKEIVKKEGSKRPKEETKDEKPKKKPSKK